ncbi:MAG: glutamate-5-semialdehyde dehydrogenase [Planctomycetales bacterium]|nr:glutamate-5-semialdehyde dehydrogenase [Planctomycetales bacterium]
MGVWVRKLRRNALGERVSTITDSSVDLQSYCLQTAQRAREASRRLATLSSTVKDAWLQASAEALVESTADIMAANARDLAAAPGYGLSDAAVDRLRLDAGRIAQIAHALREIAALRDPVGETIEGQIRPNGLEIRKVRVPLGTVFFIYESRPNVTVDAAAICVKSGNAVILRGGKEALHSSMAMVDILSRVGESLGLPPAAVQLVNTTDRDAVGHFLALDQWIDVAIPRGGKGLIERVVAEACMPVIKHFDGNCHVYLDAGAEERMAVEIVVNSKCQRMGVCNACESLLVHAAVAARLLPRLAEELADQGVELRGDAATCELVPAARPASEEDWSAEYLGPILSCKIVDDVEQAISHINRYGSRHTDAIVTNDLSAALRFQAGVDSSAVVVNASTRFNDGGEFGLGAEIGISTDKFHARGPCGLKELTTYKYLVVGNGQIRS